MPGEQVEEKWHDISLGHRFIVCKVTNYFRRSQGKENQGTSSDEGTEAQRRDGFVRSESSRQPDLD